MKKIILMGYTSAKPYAAALSFSGRITYNIIAFYFGLCFKDNYVRYFFLIFCSFLLSAISYYRLIEMLRSRNYNNSLFINLAIALFFFCCFIVSCFLFGFSFNTLNRAMQFLVYCVPSMIWGIDIVVSKRTDFLISFERIGLVLIPAVVMYVTMSMLQINPFNYNRDLGIISYMSFAYGLTPFMASSVILFLSSDNSFGDFKWSARFKYFRPLYIILCWMAIVLSGTRGTVLSGILLFIIIIFYHIVAKKQILKSLIVSATAVIIMLFVLFVPKTLLGFAYNLIDRAIVTITSTAPDSTPVYDNRIVSYLKKVQEGNFDTSNEDPVVSLNIDYLVSLPTLITEETFSSKQEYEDAKHMISLIKDRMTLFTLAIKETIKQPLTGIGPLGFTQKYVFYPHNTPLELLSELGLFIGGFLVIFVAVLFIRLFLRSLRDVFTSHVFLLICSMSGTFLFSGTVWTSLVLFFAFGFSITALGTKYLTETQKREDVL